MVICFTFWNILSVTGEDDCLSSCPIGWAAEWLWTRVQAKGSWGGRQVVWAHGVCSLGKLWRWLSYCELFCWRNELRIPLPSRAHSASQRRVWGKGVLMGDGCSCCSWHAARRTGSTWGFHISWLVPMGWGDSLLASSWPLLHLTVRNITSSAASPKKRCLECYRSEPAQHFHTSTIEKPWTSPALYWQVVWMLYRHTSA